MRRGKKKQRKKGVWQEVRVLKACQVERQSLVGFGLGGGVGLQNVDGKGTKMDRHGPYFLNKYGLSQYLVL